MNDKGLERMEIYFEVLKDIRLVGQLKKDIKSGIHREYIGMIKTVLQKRLIPEHKDIELNIIGRLPDTFYGGW